MIRNESVSHTLVSRMGDLAARKFNAANGGEAAIRPVDYILKDLNNKLLIWGGLQGSLCIDIDTPDGMQGRQV